MFGNGKQKEQALEERAEKIASEATESLRELKRTARVHADDVRKDAVKLLNSAAERIRHEAHEAKASEEVRSSADKVAKGLEKAAVYLRRHSLEDVGDDMTVAVKRRPWRNMAIVFGAGLLIGLALRGGDRSK